MKGRNIAVVWIILGFIILAVGIMSFRGLVVANEIFSMRNRYRHGDLVIDSIDMHHSVRGRSGAVYGVGTGELGGVLYKYTLEWEPRNRGFWMGYDWDGFLNKKIEVAFFPEWNNKIVCAKSMGAIPKRVHDDIGWIYFRSVLCVALEILVGVCLMRHGLKAHISHSGN